MEEKIIEVIDGIRPYLILEGGDIEFVKYEDNFVYVKVSGHCNTCEMCSNVNECLYTCFI